MAALSVQRALLGQHQGEPLALAGGGESLAERAIAGNAARGSDAPNAEPLGGADRLGYQHIHDGRLDAGAQVAEALRVVEQVGVVAQKIAHRGFQPAEAEVVVRVVNHWPGKVKGLGVSSFGQPVNLRSGGIRQADQLADLVEALARGVVHGRAEQVVVKFGADMDEQGVAAADDERDVGLEVERNRRPGGWPLSQGE